MTNEEYESPKFPSMKHVPWSKEDARRNKYLDNLDFMHFTERHAVMTEKLDGANACLTSDKVYARSHSHEASGEQWDLLKKKHAEELAHRIPEKLAIYGEWMYAKHSIKYTELPDYFVVFSVFNMARDQFLTWDETKQVAKMLQLPHAPVIKEGEFDESWKIEPEGESAYGDTREGYVIRTGGRAHYGAFKQNFAKCVRKDHVQTEELHWRKGSEIETNELAGDET